MRQTVMEIDLNALNHNINEIKKYIKNQNIIPVIKANGYGTFINMRTDILNNFDIVGVAIVDEAIALRNFGYKNEILVLNQPFYEEIDDIIKYNISVGICEKSFIQKVIDNNQTAKMHLEIETGMNRTGIKVEDLQDFINLVKTSPRIIIEGVYTHFSSADNDEDYTKMQINKFEEAVKIVESNFETIKYIHASASSGILNFEVPSCNYVRPGIMLYGLMPYESSDKKIDLKPISKLKSKVSFVKEIKAGESVSYGRTFTALHDMKIATVAIGYADGLRRELSKRGQLIINNQKVPIVGKICMDSLMVDISNIENVKVGDEVYIWDNVNQYVEDIAKECDTINYEILSTISNRVLRIFK